MNNRRAWAGGALAGALVLPVLAGATHAEPSRPPAVQTPPDAPALTPEQRLAVQALAHSILARMPAGAGQGGTCAPPTLDSLRAAVADAIGQTDPSREVALAALALAHQQAPPSASCVLAALDDTADELDGSGATVDDAGKVRGFTLYMGPLPPYVHRVSNP
jgi:hypothetical protein